MSLLCLALPKSVLLDPSICNRDSKFWLLCLALFLGIEYVVVNWCCHHVTTEQYCEVHNQLLYALVV